MLRPRDVAAGLIAAAAALLAMSGIAAAGLVLLDAGRVGDVSALTAVAVTLAAGAPATLSATPSPDVPISLQAVVEVMPLGVTLAGGVVLGMLLLRRGADGLWVRGAVATVAVAAELLAVAQLAGGTATVRLPDDVRTANGEAMTGGAIRADGCPGGGGLPFADGLPAGGGDGNPETLDVGFSVAGGPAAVAGATGALVVVAACWLVLRFRSTTRRSRVARSWPTTGIAVAALIAAWTSGGAAATGGVLLVLPLALAGALPIGLGVPFTVQADGVLGCVLDGAEPIATTGALMWVSGATLLVAGVLAAARADGRSAITVVARMGVIAGTVLAGMALLGEVNVALGAFGGTVRLLDARLGADPLLALVIGLGAGAAAGIAGIALVQASRSLASVSWRPWKDRVRP